MNHTDLDCYTYYSDVNDKLKCIYVGDSFRSSSVDNYYIQIVSIKEMLLTQEVMIKVEHIYQGKNGHCTEFNSEDLINKIEEGKYYVLEEEVSGFSKTGVHCTCELHTMMNLGCQCGAFKKEMK